MGVGQGSEDDGNRMIVETELVKTEKQNILPVTQQPAVMQQQQNDQDGDNSTITQHKLMGINGNKREDLPGSPTRKEPHDAVDNRDRELQDDGNVTLKPLQNQHRLNSLQMQEASLQNGGNLQDKDMAAPYSNPLSTQALFSGALRNKKSSLLIDCAVDEGKDFSSLPPLAASEQMLDLSLTSADASQSSFGPSLTKQKNKPGLSKLSSYNEESYDSRGDSDSQHLTNSQESRPLDLDMKHGVLKTSTPTAPLLMSQMPAGTGVDSKLNNTGSVLPLSTLASQGQSSQQQQQQQQQQQDLQADVQQQQTQTKKNQKELLDQQSQNHHQTLNRDQTQPQSQAQSQSQSQTQSQQPQPQPQPQLQNNQPKSATPLTISQQPSTSVLTDSESVRRLNKESSSKADFFAARLATAVGENEISDSEETFVYQSTANSVKNASLNDASSMQNNTLNSLQHVNAKPYGIPAKLSAPQLKQNEKLLNRLKNTRHTSIAAIPNSQGPVSSNSEKDDIASLKSMNKSSLQEIQSIKSHRTQLSVSPRKRLSTASLQNVQNRQQKNQQQSTGTGNGVVPKTLSTPTRSTYGVSAKKGGKPPPTYQNQKNSGKQPLLQNSVANGQNIAGAKGHNRTSSRPGENKKGVTTLRTRSSKVFDPNGSSLRRYSGVPDDVNLEDFVDQYDGEFDLTVSRQQKGNDKKALKYYHPSNAASQREISSGIRHDQYDTNETISDYADDGTEAGPDDMESASDNSAVHALGYHEVPNYDELSYVDEDADDIESMFYYNGSNVGPSHTRVGRRFSELDESGAEDIESDSQGFFYRDPNQLERGVGAGAGNNNNNNGLPNNGPLLQSNFHQATEFTPLKNKKLTRKRSDFYSDYSPHNFYTKKSSWVKFKNFIYFSFVVASLLTLGFISGFLLATNKDLHDFQLIAMDNVLVSLDELVFDITATAFNPGIFTIGIKDVELDIFAKTNHLKVDVQADVHGDPHQPPPPPGKTTATTNGVFTNPYQTILLGTVYNLETELQFRGRLLNRNYDVSVASVKLLNPGAPKNSDDRDDDDDDDDDGRDNDADDKNNHKLENDIDRWKQLIKHEFELIVRGNLYYTIPFFKNEKVIPVQQQIVVDPNKSPY